MSSNTSIYACPNCGNPNTHGERRPEGIYYCPDCNIAWKIGENQPKQTLFHRLTASPEVLAPHFVYGDKEGYFYSTIIEGERFLTIVKAIAATVAKLKEPEA